MFEENYNKQSVMRHKTGMPGRCDAGPGPTAQRSLAMSVSSQSGNEVGGSGVAPSSGTPFIPDFGLQAGEGEKEGEIQAMASCRRRSGAEYRPLGLPRLLGLLVLGGVEVDVVLAAVQAPMRLRVPSIGHTWLYNAIYARNLPLAAPRGAPATRRQQVAAASAGLAAGAAGVCGGADARFCGAARMPASLQARRQALNLPCAQTHRLAAGVFGGMAAARAWQQQRTDAREV